jgi:fructosamine-3-kinase
MLPIHPLLDADVKRTIERAVSQYVGRSWACRALTNLNDQASHPAGVLRGEQLSVFAKLSRDHEAAEQFSAELSGLAFVRETAGVATPTPIANGVFALERGCVLLFEALPERLPEARTREDWRAIGRALATLHQVHAEHFGLDGRDGFFGPFRQDNRPVESNRWVDFYLERRLSPFLRSAVDAGHLPLDVADDIERLALRLPELCGPEPVPSLLHGDAQQHNFVSTDAGAVLIDVAPYFGHPELDLALVDYFDAVPSDVFDAYSDIAPIQPDFTERRELWRLFAYLAVVTFEVDTPLGRRILQRLIDAVAGYLRL